jgi:hypothetical protein
MGNDMVTTGRQVAVGTAIKLREIVIRAQAGTHRPIWHHAMQGMDPRLHGDDRNCVTCKHNFLNLMAVVAEGRVEGKGALATCLP